MLFYASTMPARAMHQVEHAAIIAEHDHSGPSDFPVDVVYDAQAHDADHHPDAPDDDERTGDPLAGGHHHHGDSGPNLLVPGTAGTAAIPLSSGLHGLGKDRQIAGVRPVGPERPPRSLSLTI